jgi:hypothetical protein
MAPLSFEVCVTYPDFVHIDSRHYEVDQLILGVFTFGLPTILTAALLFTFVWNSCGEFNHRGSPPSPLAPVDEIGH